MEKDVYMGMCIHTLKYTIYRIVCYVDIERYKQDLMKMRKQSDFIFRSVVERERREYKGGRREVAGQVTTGKRK